ncbi:MAG TPA: glycogen/starch/alpha-glucan phosphorylase [Gammaproteobacteria bacterium]|nr:glycogen/starch/alpha-glucan phosphorylase [Gammaproteobacteria bacterium]
MLDESRASTSPASDVERLKRAFVEKLFYIQGKFPKLATQNDYYLALAYAVRDRMLRRWVNSAAAYTDKGVRTVAYLSAEYLMGPHLGNNLVNLDIYEVARAAMAKLGLDLEALLRHEPEPGLGNGGLGRLAACFLDSLSTLEIPTLGYGIRYEFGIFDQEIVDGWQVEKTDKWLTFGNPWEIARPEWAVNVRIGGHVEQRRNAAGRLRAEWVPERTVQGVPYDTPVLGYRNNTANTLRLWRAEAPESFNFSVFNSGDYYGAVNEKVRSENLTKVLYPNDEQVKGRQLRLEQQYFLVSCSLQDMLRIVRVQGIPPSRFHEKFAAQLNDTHPAVAIPELMRLLVDEQDLDWDTAWEITRSTFAYTNHTLLPEALECWPVDLFARVLPRHMEIVYEINARFLERMRMHHFGDDPKVAAMSLIDENGERYVRMAHLATVGSHAINGVSALHTELLKASVLKEFYELWPERFSNKTNGVTPRRWVALANPRLTELVTEAIGEDWVRELGLLRKLEAYADDAAFLERFSHVKRTNKEIVASQLLASTGISVDPASIFDVQVKRIHEYKRQHLNILHIIALYQRLKSGVGTELPARTFIFGGKAAPGYHFAKLIIKLINSVAAIVNNDPQSRDKLRVVFMPNFNVTRGQQVYPAAELSEQISTAGKEASGTGNMKFAMNGALTIGTMDGANIELREEIGAENFFDFGLDAEEIAALRACGYSPAMHAAADAELASVLELISSGYFSHGDGHVFAPIIENLTRYDPYFVLADFRAYADCQQKVAEAYAEPARWARMALLNTARSGKFSSDRTIAEYCRDTWRVSAFPIELDPHEATIVQ